MVNSNLAEDIAAENERSLSTLVRTIARFQGTFSLTIVRCNYASLRSEMLQKLRARSTVEYQELVLEPATKTLYQTILNAVQEQPPKALIVVGIESVVAIDDLLAGANRARDQFTQDFAFPLILWVTDAVLDKFSRSANDLKSWAPPPIQFTIPPDDLMNLLRQKVEQAFANVDNFQLDDCEIESLENDLLNMEAALDPELQASWQFILGLVKSPKNLIDLAIEHYQQSLAFWQQNHQWARQGIVCHKIAEAYNRQAELRRTGNQDYWQKARKYLQQSLESFEQSQRHDLATKYISKLGEVLRLLQSWEELQILAVKALKMHESYGTPSQVAKDYGFLAEVALQRSEWEKACELAKSALSALTPAEVSQQETGLYLLLLAKGQRNLSQQSEAVKNLEAAKENTQPQYDVQLYLRILEELRTLYFEQGEYLKAFYLKLEQQAVKSKYGLQAFIGASRLQSPQQIIDIGLASGKSKAEILEEIEAASGRAQDIKEISKRIGTPACKLTIVHGQSGVGKSSIIQAWLVPALQLTTFQARDVLPVLLQSYHDWARDCGQCLQAGIERLKAVSWSGAIDTPTAILEQLRLNQERNLLTVLIFDQFEEFFFAYRDTSGRQELYDFLAECLNQISDLKIILSLREDYLCYLLEFNRATNLSIIDNDILTKKICYYLGNFSILDATTIVQKLTKGSQFYLDDDLVNALVADLAGEVGEVRPIELQIVGMQLEKRQITRLSEYQQLGDQAKLKLVEQFLAEVIADCGNENKDIAGLVLYLLTDENNTRPQKTLPELAADLRSELETLELVIEIVVKSGLVLEVPGDPIERYQLVHDYLVPFIRQQRGAELLELREKLKQIEAENQILAEARQKVELLLVAAQKLIELKRVASDALDLERFCDACNPTHSLMLGNSEDIRYYIDFAAVRGGKIINILQRTITRLSPDKPTCQLFTGHIGCGKSTELLRLQKELTDEGFYVVYFQSTQDLDEMDLDLTDIMLAIARRVTQSLEEGKIYLQPQDFKEFLKNSWSFLQTPVSLEAEGELFSSKIKGNTDGNLELSLPLGIAKITAKTQRNPDLRSKLRQYMEPQANKMLELINQEIIDVAINQLKQQGKKGLVVIVDNLDRIVSRPNAAGRGLPEYIFIDRGDQLRQLNCHLVYTMPLGLIFGNESEILKNRFAGRVDPKVLPMVPVKNRDGSECVEGMNLLRRMVMSRAFPDMLPEEQITLITEVFDTPETLDELCRVSGGHLRNLMGMLFGCLQQDDPPISLGVLKSVIRSSRDHLSRAIDNDEWELLFKVVKEQTIKGDKEYQDLSQNLWIFEYVDSQGNWFALNPLLMETENFKRWQQQNY